MACSSVRRATTLLRKSRAWICNVLFKRTRPNASTGLVEQRSGCSPGWLINPHIQLPFHLWLRWSCQLTLQIQTKIFSYENCPNWARLLSKFTQLKCLLTEAWGRSTEPLETMAWVITAKASQRNFVKECLYVDQKLQLCSTGNEC